MDTLIAESTSHQDLDDSGCVQDASVTENGYKGQVQLLDLSDDVLLYVLKYCAPQDLKALGHTCPRLGALVCDRTLWTRVDARSTPMGEERVRWLLTHCLSPTTLELQLTGYANKSSKCLGIQDLHWPADPETGSVTASHLTGPRVDVEHLLFRMWYPHLPRFAVSPRWPDKEEAASKDPRGPETDKEPSIEAGPSSSKKSSEVESSDASSGKKKSGKSPLSKKFNPFANDCKGPQFTLTTHLLRDLRNKCSKLTSLSLEYCNIDYKTTNICQFPPNLKKLSLRGTLCYNLPLSTSFLGKIQERLPGLEYLDVSECDWFEPASLMPLSKLAYLRELYMRDCKRLSECVAYASLATRYGFRQLKVMDVRGSPLADSEISALGWLPLLEELYCSPPEEVIRSSEHTHSWKDTRITFSELDHWEREEPEYYKIKMPEPSGDIVEGPVSKFEIPMQEPVANAGDTVDRMDDFLLGNPWWLHERRIIVIQPNANRQVETRLLRARPQAANLLDPDAPAPGPSGQVPAPSNQEPASSGQVPAPSSQEPASSGQEPAPLSQEQASSSQKPAPMDQGQPPLDEPEPVSQKSVPSNQGSASKYQEQASSSEPQPIAQGLLSPDVKPIDEPQSNQGSVTAEPDSINKKPELMDGSSKQGSEKPAPIHEVVEDQDPALKDVGSAPMEQSPAQIHEELPKQQPSPTVQTPSSIRDSTAPVDQEPAPILQPRNPVDQEPLNRVKRPRLASGLLDDESSATIQPGPSKRPIIGSQAPNTVKRPRFDTNAQNEDGEKPVSENQNSGLNVEDSQSRNPARVQAIFLPNLVSATKEFLRNQARIPVPVPDPNVAEVPDVPDPQLRNPRLGQVFPLPNNVPPARDPQGRNRAQGIQLFLNNADELFNFDDDSEYIQIPVDLPRNLHPRDRLYVEHIVREPPRVYNRGPIPLVNQNRAEQCPRLRNQSREDEYRARLEELRRNVDPLLHLDVQRQSTIHVGHAGYYLVSDSAIVRFGRADNDNVNYVNIGPNGVRAGEPGTRPDRSNLRILSVTGYRNITDRSLVHLATAAPHIMSIDFSETSVTARGVEIFKAIRPNCEVIYSQYRK